MLWVIMYSALNCGRLRAISQASKISSISDGSRITAPGIRYPQAAAGGTCGSKLAQAMGT
jgi:hypothetical protein